ncbi:adenine methylase [Clostridia bacterium]|nr:adenine methylase [Clostridia bacterium]
MSTECNKKYSIILADLPARFGSPWSYRVWGKKGKGRSAGNHYPTMNIDDICSLPVAEIADKDCTLFLWSTFPNLIEAFKVVSAWGFKYSTVAFVWVKRNKVSPEYFMGCGYWTRANAEIVLLATKGKPKRISKSVRQIVDTPIGRHSEKPFVVREKIIELIGDLPRIELFARTKTDGWDSWGNEVACDIEL